MQFRAKDVKLGVDTRQARLKIGGALREQFLSAREQLVRPIKKCS
jgi:hypothetical protein